MGYPAPVDVGAVSGNAWILVAIPDDPAYRTAALGAYSDLANVWLWGEDAIHPDAATIRQQWLNAIDETIEALEMGFPATLIAAVDGIETLLSQILAKQGCCPDNVSYLPVSPIGNPNGYTYTSGPHPSTWGESTPVADLPTYQDLICGSSHSYVDILVSLSVDLDTFVQSNLITLGAVVTILGALATGGLSTIVQAALAATVFTTIVDSWTTDLFSDAAAAIESARSDIICAIFSGNGTTLSDVIEATVSTSAWLLLYKWIDYQSAINVMLTGELDGQYMEPRTGETCNCSDTPAGYTLVPFTSYTTLNPVNGGTATHLGGGVWRFSGNANAGATMNLNTAAHGIVDPDYFNKFRGFECKVVALSGAINFAVRGGTDIYTEDAFNMVIDENCRGGHADVAGWVANADRTINYDQGATKKFFYAMQSGGGAYTADIYIAELWLDTAF